MTWWGWLLLGFAGLVILVLVIILAVILKFCGDFFKTLGDAFWR